ncbi:photosystem II reaction center protein Psb28 [Aphanothece sacrum]|jgi:photosystem II Psb28-2 protein|uniref:Photosystem II reaction center Psb28 protein n=1 Tax=Aphanothece sacrum FPU1 TaxID=1920663 RepID=A0A401IGX6_APHSA|nr:photosystem II reaction center protein Psb28 [Aphanothece sacrum]GBF80471.1 photosystem II reaction center Psb28 protein [Aphanothece sacrum FPU1]GBF85552.1 photosystem II reaction center protein Psb28 [Aphanothece sacrum FPU3]
MTTTPSLEFFVGISEDLSNVSLRRSKETGIRNVLLIFDKLKSLEKFKSFTEQTYGDLRLIDSEGEISVTPSSLRIIWGGDEGDDLKRVECGFEIHEDDHWERFMRFMNRYAEANGMGYQDTKE